MDPGWWFLILLVFPDLSSGSRVRSKFPFDKHFLNDMLYLKLALGYTHISMTFDVDIHDFRGVILGIFSNTQWYSRVHSFWSSRLWTQVCVSICPILSRPEHAQYPSDHLVCHNHCGGKYVLSVSYVKSKYTIKWQMHFGVWFTDNKWIRNVLSYRPADNRMISLFSMKIGSTLVLLTI